MRTRYSVIRQVVSNNKRIGFEVRDNVSGIVKRIKLEDVKSMIDDKCDIDIKYTGRGFEFKDGRKIGDLPVRKMQENKTGNKRGSKIGNKRDSIKELEVYTGKELKKYTERLLEGITKERDFVKGIVYYINSKMKTVWAISGLRGTGKTVGMLQAIKDIGKYDKTVFINIPEDANISCSGLKEYIDKKCRNIDYIFVDEVTRVWGLYNQSAFLYDRLIGFGKKVVLSGTDSLAIVKSEECSLFHRVIIKNVTIIKYSEAKRTIEQTFDEYRQMGGLYKSAVVTDIKGMRRYINTSVVNNIMNTLTKNDEITSMLNLRGIDKEKLRTLVFKIIYTVIYTSTQEGKAINISRMINQFNVKNEESKDYFINLICSKMGVNNKISFKEMEIMDVLDAMEELNLLVKAPNIVNKDEYKYYITNPSLINQILYLMSEILKSEGLVATERASIEGFNGYILESIVMYHIVGIMKRYGCELYYYRDKSNREIDVVIKKEDNDEFTDDTSKYLVYEVKLTYRSDVAVLKSSWIHDENVASNIEGMWGKILDRAVIYRGEDKEFNGFESSDLKPTKNMTLDEIEEKNKGLKLLNVEEFLLNLESTMEKYFGNNYK